MSEIFVGQTLLTINIATGFDLSTAEVKRILWKNPKGVTGSWEAEGEANELTYEVQDDDLNLPGAWTLQPYLEVSGKKVWGKIVTMQVKPPVGYRRPRLGQ